MKILSFAKSLCKNQKKNYLQMQAYDYPGVSDGWVKYKSNPILGSDKEIFFDPVVRYYENNYIMCVSNRTKNYIQFFKSENGIDWIDSNLKYCGNNKCWCRLVNRACFLKKEDTIYLWYTGQVEGKSAIGFALSKDGINFLDVVDKAVVSPSLDFEKNSVMNPCVLWDDDKKLFRMWYAAGDYYEPDVICYAESEDGICWNKITKPVVCANRGIKYKKKKVGACEVIRYQDHYLMAYIVYQNIHVARIALASSKDGYVWKDLKCNPIIGPDRKSWDAHSVYKPTICYDSDNDRLMLWYNGRKDKVEAIGLAYKYGVVCDE